METHNQWVIASVRIGAAAAITSTIAMLFVGMHAYTSGSGGAYVGLLAALVLVVAGALGRPDAEATQPED